MAAVVVIVGSGLAGLSAALEVAASGDVHVVLIEQEPRLGGNSMKASSGINALTPETGDSTDRFTGDVLRSGGELSNPELVRALVENSTASLQFLERRGVDLSVVLQLGGHSKPRTHKNARGPNVGCAIVQPLAQEVAAHANVTVRTGCRATQLLGSDTIDGVEIESVADGARDVVACGAAILATGGFAASADALRRWAPAHAHLPTTNGPHATGAGMLMGQRRGAELVQMGSVQVHPTGFVDPADPAARTKFLAPEALRGCGAVLLDASGARFCDELSTRDALVEAMGRAAAPVWVALPAAAAARFGDAALQFYAHKGLMTPAADAAAAAVAMGVDGGRLNAQLLAYNAAAGGAATDAFGKTVFPAAFDLGGAIWLARVTPAVHYCMGGVRVDADGQALTEDGAPVAGLFAAGEVTGGLHGRNRLAGNSLLDCVVFGRRAGGAACRYVRRVGPLGDRQ